MAEKHLKMFNIFCHHIACLRMVNIKNLSDSICWQRHEARRTLLHCWSECKIVQTLWKSVGSFSENGEYFYLNTQVYLSWTYTQRCSNISKRHVFHYFHSRLICKSQILEIIHMTFNRRMDTENVIHFHNGILFSYSKWEHHEFCRKLDGIRKYNPEWNDSDPKKTCMHVIYSLISG